MPFFRFLNRANHEIIKNHCRRRATPPHPKMLADWRLKSSMQHAGWQRQCCQNLASSWQKNGVFSSKMLQNGSRIGHTGSKIVKNGSRNSQKFEVWSRMRFLSVLGGTWEAKWRKSWLRLAPFWRPFSFKNRKKASKKTSKNRCRKSIEKWCQNWPKMMPKWMPKLMIFDTFS